MLSLTASGTWIPLGRAKSLAQKLNIFDDIAILFEDVQKDESEEEEVTAKPKNQRTNAQYQSFSSSYTPATLLHLRVSSLNVPKFTYVPKHDSTSTTNDKIVVENIDRQTVIEDCHISDGVHLDLTTTIISIRRQYIWPTLSNDVRLFFSTCLGCDYDSKLPLISKVPSPTPARKGQYAVSGFFLDGAMDGSTGIRKRKREW